MRERAPTTCGPTGREQGRLIAIESSIRKYFPSLKWRLVSLSLSFSLSLSPTRPGCRQSGRWAEAKRSTERTEVENGPGDPKSGKSNSGTYCTESGLHLQSAPSVVSSTVLFVSAKSRPFASLSRITTSAQLLQTESCLPSCCCCPSSASDRRRRGRGRGRGGAAGAAASASAGLGRTAAAGETATAKAAAREAAGSSAADVVNRTKCRGDGEANGRGGRSTGGARRACGQRPPRDTRRRRRRPLPPLDIWQIEKRCTALAAAVTAAPAGG